MRERPVLTIQGDVQYIFDLAQAEKCCQQIMSISEDTIECGFDAEWTVTYDGSTNPVSVIQLCVHDPTVSDYRTYVMQLNAICASSAESTSLPPCIRRLLVAKRLTKIGLNIKNDIERLSRDFDLPCDHIVRHSMVDLNDFANRVLNSTERWSLQSLVLNQLKHQLPKPAVRTSDWHVYPLSSSQIDYAALDAFVG